MANDGKGYNAGNLEFAVQQISDSALSSLDKLIGKLKTTMTLLGSTSSITKNLGTALGGKSGRSASSYNRQQKTYAEESNKQYLKSLTNITKQGKELSKITKIFDAQGKVIKNTIVSVDAMGNKITKIYGGQKGKNPLTTLTGTFSLTNLLNKVYFLRNYMAQTFRTSKAMLQNAIDYAETLNLWNVAIQGYNDLADEFIKKMNKAYGISTQTLMQYQAVFKNMVGSLGGISDSVGYQLSEYLTQMALDYASLYNVSIQRAMTTFQSMLSGEVVPIRSVAGYDITEITIYEVYKQLGGEKTIRQLNQVEKRLLRIYATFQQMSNSGAIGDLGKTIESSANQMRMFTESMKELSTWIGLVFEMALRHVLPYMNAFVITATNIAKALAKSLGYKPDKYDAVNKMQELGEEAEKTSGKLLEFDKFSALGQNQEQSSLNIDEKLLQGMLKYRDILDSVEGKAQELAKVWTSWFIDSETGGITKNARILLDSVKSITLALGVLLGYKLISKLTTVNGKIDILGASLRLLKFTLVTGIIYSIVKAIELFKDGDYWGGILATTIGVGLVGAFILLNKEIIKTIGTKIIAWFQTLILQSSLAKTSIQKLQFATGSLIVGFIALTGGIASLSSQWGDMQSWERVVTIFVSLAAAIGAAAAAFYIFKQNWAMALGVGATVAGAGLTIGSQLSSITAFKNGGQVEDGIFTMNKGEVMGTFDDGTSIVANNQQIIEGIKQGVYSAVRSAMVNNGSGDVVLKIDSKELARATVSANANALSKNYRVEFQPR